MDVVDEIKRRVDLVEFIGRTTRLQKSGRNFRGLCPFHTEKTPSFYVFTDRATWRCFGSCGEGGDLFSFVQKRDSVEFKDALRELAREAGVELSAGSSERRSKVDRLASAMAAAVTYYEQRLAGPEGEAARAYLTDKRGIRPDTIAAFHVGWAPDDWRGLRGYLHGRGYSDEDMIGAGLLVEPENGREPYDRFRGRVIIPISDERGRFVAMGGRGTQGEEPKYLNSPQTELFDKGRTLFGLYGAADTIRAAGTVVVVEGYMDVIGPWQAGFANVVATMGTSLTENHAALLKRFARRVVLAMDPDAAGLAAAERAGGLFLGLDSPENMARSARSADALAGKAELDLRVAPLPAGQDPDEVARDDPEAWERAIQDAVPFAEFLLSRIIGAQPPESPLEARRLVDRMAPVLQAVRDPVERAMYVQRVARRLQVNEDAVIERIRGSLGGRARATAIAPGNPLSPEGLLLSLVLRNPHLRVELRGYPPNLFGEARGRETFARWLQGEDFEAGDDDDPVCAYARSLLARRLPPLSEEDARAAVMTKIREITRERVAQHHAAVTEELAEAEKRLGANAVAVYSREMWEGTDPGADGRELAETTLED
ncbi:DNA primase [bacterium]|nr:DNA primase [bacterium]